MVRLVASAALAVLTLIPSHAAFAADDLSSVLSKLDAASAKFRTTTAEFEFDATLTEPVPDTDVQKGTVYYQREDGNFQMGVHVATDNGQLAPKVIVCCSKGGIQLYEKLPDQVTTLSKLSQYEGWFLLGFGASGKELQEKWEVKYDGPEIVDGVQTAKLELVPKDPTVKKNLPRVILWMDTDRAVSVKQYFDEGEGQSRTCHYTDIKLNQPLPKDAFTFKTDGKTTFVNR